MALKRLCKAAGCKNLADFPNRYCEHHKALENPEQGRYLGGNYEDLRKPYDYLYRSVRWREASKDFLKANDTCCKCGKKATIVDHIIPHRGDELLFWDSNNWQPLCAKCHQLKTLEEIRQRQKEKAAKVKYNKKIGKLWY